MITRARVTPNTLASILCVTVIACAGEGGIAERPPCDSDNGGITLPDGFCAVVLADTMGPVRHMAGAPNGDLYVMVRDQTDAPGSVLALRDSNGDGKADVIARFGPSGGTGIALRGNTLYFAPDDAILRYTLTPGELVPAAPPDTIVKDLPNVRSHRSKTLAFDETGGMYVNIGAPSNSCQIEDRTTGSRGQDPCPDLETRAGIWKFDANRIGQTPADGTRFATGMRNTVALTMNPLNSRLYAAIHGRDQLLQNWPQYYDEEDSAEKPAEEFVQINAGDDFGWPYCYYDPIVGAKLLAPEYGGDGEKRDRCATKKDPLIGFPGHWAPDGLVFYTGSQFPERYRGGAFIAFHGSWNRAPLPQGGYNVVFVPFAGDAPSGPWEVFADGFKGQPELMAREDAVHRPTGLAVGPDGSLYLSDDQGGRIWRIMYPGPTP